MTASPEVITEIELRSQMEHSDFLQSTLDALAAHIAVLDQHGTIILVNKAWRQYSECNGGTPLSIGVGTNYLAVCDHADGSDADEALSVSAGLRAVMAADLQEFSLEYPCHSPREQRWFRMSATPFEAEGPIRIVVAHEDITTRKQAEEALQEAHDSLELRVVERTRELTHVNAQLATAAEQLRQAKTEAEQANRAKSEFLSRTSHELRTPMNAILGFAQILEMASLTPSQAEGVSYILKSGRHLLSLIDEVLDISSIEAGHLQLSLLPVAVADLLQETLELVRSLAAQRGITLSAILLPCEEYVQADRQRLIQVLLNLLSNAVKYNREGGTVTITYQTILDGRLRLLVHDTGQGLTPEQVARLFTPFDRVGAERTGVEGTGLGLALSKQLVNAMKGELELTSKPGQGSTFSVTLQQAQEPVLHNPLTH